MGDRLRPMGNRRWLYSWWGSPNLRKHIIARGGAKSFDKMTTLFAQEKLKEFFREAERIGLIVDDGTGWMNDSVAQSSVSALELMATRTIILSR